MFDGKLKAVTFSYDDGVVQDIRFIRMLDKYRLKCTFNLNSECDWKGRIPAEQYAEVYKNHEVAVHTLTHPYLKDLDNDEIVRQIEQDRINLERVVGYPIRGMAYPYGSGMVDDRVLSLVKSKTKILYARATKPTYNFEIQTELLNFEPTIHHSQFDKLFELAQEFIELKPDSPKIFYIWGHTYEFDNDDGIYWEKMEEFCKLISGREDTFYGTNSEVLLGVNIDAGKDGNYQMMY